VFLGGGDVQQTVEELSTEVVGVVEGFWADLYANPFRGILPAVFILVLVWLLKGAPRFWKRGEPPK
jgi:hypothetical protein